MIYTKIFFTWISENVYEAKKPDMSFFYYLYIYG